MFCLWFFTLKLKHRVFTSVIWKLWYGGLGTAGGPALLWRMPLSWEWQEIASWKVQMAFLSPVLILPKAQWYCSYNLFSNFFSYRNWYSRLSFQVISLSLLARGRLRDFYHLGLKVTWLIHWVACEPRKGGEGGRKSMMNEWNPSGEHTAR